jgi:hypothetical protein
MYGVQANPSPDRAAMAVGSKLNLWSVFTITAAFTTGAMMALFDCKAAGRKAVFN